MNYPNPDDDLLRQRLRRIDPAAPLQPATETEILRMVNNATSAPKPTKSPKLIFIGLGALTAGVAAAAIVGVSLSGNDLTRIENPSASGPAVMCAELTPETVARADFAVAGTVTDIDGDEVTLQITTRYTGDSSDEIILQQQDADQPSELSAGEFVTGQDYLISSIDGFLTLCGQSGPATPELQQLYAAAF